VIDWGCAARQDEQLKHYRGRPPYSYGALLHWPGSTEWEPKAVHDHVSCALAVAHLLAAGTNVCAMA
jgi:hypothetical protein